MQALDVLQQRAEMFSAALQNKQQYSAAQLAVMRKGKRKAKFVINKIKACTKKQ